MNIVFDMETGDPDDLITLLLLLVNPDVQLRGITCWQGSPRQIGLINHVLDLANIKIPVGGLNDNGPEELSPYYTEVVGDWKSVSASTTPNEVFEYVLKNFPDTKFLTGAPLTNLAAFVKTHVDIIESVTTQGGFLGNLAVNPLDKFKNKKEIRTYNLTNDTNAFTEVNKTKNIKDLTYVTKDLCHGFMYTPEIHANINFGNSPIHQLLHSCLNRYASAGKSKAMHDPLAMLYMLYPEIGVRKSIEMSFRIDDKKHSVFSSVQGNGNRYGLIDYDKEKAWGKFIQLCQSIPQQKLKM